VPVAIAVIAIAILVARRIPNALPHPGWVVVLVGCAVVVNAVVFGVARGVKRFAWLGLAVFLSVPLLGGVLAAVRTHLAPKVQPVALIRKSDNVGICGVYVTETDKRVYVGRVEAKDDDGARGAYAATGRIFWVRDDDVDVIKIGALQSLKTAARRAPRLLAELYRDRPEDTGVPLKATTVTDHSTTESDAPRETVREEQPKPRQQSRPKPRPRTTANVCTDVSLRAGGQITGTAPVDDAKRGRGPKAP
jgi:hypothetical protein